ncbi:hypothetical protein BDP27DRAFT_1027546 [Rhodocollybia butyracea]|uniref:Uncharacterized protein n=1 Tax=Rhodocollybia butyracea TaxID=206335 RepID=A0A9P5P0I2_9AGAR|nr:hypothetical protein BDP27DRAFT_1027546 [Rhodocollybia butyracea]
MEPNPVGPENSIAALSTHLTLSQIVNVGTITAAESPSLTAFILTATTVDLDTSISLSVTAQAFSTVNLIPSLDTPAPTLSPDNPTLTLSPDITTPALSPDVPTPTLSPGTPTPIPSPDTPTLRPDIPTPSQGTPDHAHTVSAGPVVGAVMGSMLVLAIGISIFIHLYRRRHGRGHGQVEAGRSISPSQQNMTLGADTSDIVPNWHAIPQAKKGCHDSVIPIPILTPLRPQFPGESTSTWTTSSSEIPWHPESPLTLRSESCLTPTSTLIQEGPNQDDMRAQMVRMEATIGRMAEHIRHIESKLDSDTYPPMYESDEE